MPDEPLVADLLAPSPPDRQRHAHLVGACGAGMKALAEWLHDRGWRVSGCDADPDPSVARALSRLGIDVSTGHWADHLDSAPDVLIHSAAIPDSNPERQAALDRGIPQLSYVAALGQLSRRFQTIAIAGTHGKSTTTAMLGVILQHCGRSPNILCGAESISSGRSGAAGKDDLLIVEACEYRRHFHQLRPDIICFTGIEHDHFDSYPTPADAEQAYRDFVSLLPADGTLVFNAECEVSSRLAAKAGCATVPFGIHESGAPTGLRDSAARQEPRPPGNARPHGEPRPLVLLIPGRHNLCNALAAAACASLVGITDEESRAALRRFAGLRRRFEVIRDEESATVVDDYAHHPTEIRATLAAAREAYPGRPVVAVFQPHQISRTRRLLAEFAASLNTADLVRLLPVYAARENVTDERERLVQQMAEMIGPHATVLPSLDRLWDTVQTGTGSRPVVLTLGAGNITRIHHEPDRGLS